MIHLQQTRVSQQRGHQTRHGRSLRNHLLGYVCVAAKLFPINYCVPLFTDESFWQSVLPCQGCGSTCSVLTEVSGTLSDGSGLSDYEHRALCQWIIAPAANTSNITITFKEFSTELHTDVVQVYACMNISCQDVSLIGELSGTYSAAQSLSSATGYMLVQFRSDSSISQAGFEARWDSAVSSQHAAPSVPLVS
jgi:hypothetical protein